MVRPNARGKAFIEESLKLILDSAMEVRIYGLDPDSDVGKLLKPALIRGKGVWLLDTSQELLQPFEAFWRSYCETDGIAIITRMTADSAKQVLSHCTKPDTWSSTYMIAEGSSKSAVAYCRKATESGAIVFLIPGSNGLEWIDIFAPPEVLEELFRWSTAYGKGKAV